MIKSPDQEQKLGRGSSTTQAFRQVSSGCTGAVHKEHWEKVLLKSSKAAENNV